MIKKPIIIYQSSAGSGKTYTLAKNYIRLSLKSKNYFNESIYSLRYNARILQNYLDQNLHLNPINYKNKISRQKFIDKQKKIFPEQSIIIEVNIKYDYIIYLYYLLLII